MADNRARLSRRYEYAEATRQAIVDSARKLFCERGFYGTKVEEIAVMARVSPATVYAVAGGKHGLLQTLMEVVTSGPIQCGTVEEIRTADDPQAVLRLAARLMRELDQQDGDIMRVIVETAPHEKSAAHTCGAAIHRCREALAIPAQRLASLGALKPGLDARTTVDILWFYFGFGSTYALVHQNSWSSERAEHWLTEQAACALLTQPRG